MGVTARKQKHESKMKRKRAAKAARKAAYLALAGTSKKTKRLSRKKKAGSGTTYKHAHVMANCGNVGCKRCFPQFAGRRTGIHLPRAKAA